MPLKENLWRDTVAALRRKEVPSIAPSESVQSAVSTMQAHRTGCVTVLDGERLVGIFTERDLLKRILARGQSLKGPISDFMTANPATANEGDSIGSAIMKMRNGGYRHLPVLDAHGTIKGRISVREIIHYMVEHFPKDVYNLPPKPGQVQSSREGA